ncbi:MAG: hypothetical protein PUD36_11220 [Bacteroidales bacterium]|nr:hypothetical protein [Bacteroidales bacterium]MDY4520975.1 hypothetical protein [Bacteroidales bacterium]
MELLGTKLISRLREASCEKHHKSGIHLAADRKTYSPTRSPAG